MNKYIRVTQKAFIYLRHKNLYELATFIRKRVMCSIYGYPNKLDIEPTGLCNYTCSMCWCYRATELRGNKLLSFTDFKKIIDEIDFFCAEIFLSGCGEPMLNTDIYKMIEYAKTKHIHVGMTTNGSALSKKNVIKLIKSRPDKIIISLDAAEERAYNTMRVGGNFDQVIKGVKNLTREKIKKHQIGTQIVLQMIVTKKNEHQINDFIQLANELEVDLVSFKSLFIDHRGNNQYVNNLVDNFLTKHEISRYKIENDNKIELKNTGKCPSTLLPIVTSDGDLSVCCHDIFAEYKQGNIIKNSFNSIWNNDAYKKFRSKIMKNRKLPICNYCDYSNRAEKLIKVKVEK